MEKTHEKIENIQKYRKNLNSIGLNSRNYSLNAIYSNIKPIGHVWIFWKNNSKSPVVQKES